MGKKRQNVERVTLTIPSNIRRRMRSRDDVNWSNVAARAFSNHLEAELEFEDAESEPQGFAAKWASHRRSLIKAALAEIRESHPLLRPAIFTPERVFHWPWSREIGIRIGDSTYEVEIQRPDNTAEDITDFFLTFSDDDCEAFGDDWPTLPTEPKKLYEIVQLAHRCSLWISPVENPEPGVALLGLRRTVPSLSITGRSLLDLNDEMPVALSGIMDVLTGKRPPEQWDSDRAPPIDE